MVAAITMAYINAAFSYHSYRSFYRAAPPTPSSFYDFLITITVAEFQSSIQRLLHKQEPK